jgi:CDP-diacylglycerol--glycerol-3-phosphate 3-phosphatidyltransferase
MFLAANLITMFRLFLLFFIFAVMDYGGFIGHIWAFILTIILISLDAVDGIVARWLHEDSVIGGVFDIVADRIVENCFWIFFAARGIIPVWLPLAVLTRGLLTDDIRSVALSKGMTAFGKTSLQKSWFGKAIVNSRWSRGLYGFSKMMAFLSLIVLNAMAIPDSQIHFSLNARHYIINIGYTFIYIAIAYCIIRAIPVFIDSLPFLFIKQHHNINE